MAAEKDPNASSELSQLDKMQNWYEKNGRILNAAVLSILAIILLLIAYTNIYKPKQEAAAQDAIFKAQYWFEQDSIAKALNDPGNGFLEIANNFGNTKAGNLAKYYAGLSYFQLGDYPNAEKHLAKFNVNNDEVLGGLALGTLADAQMENGNRDAALKNYKKAANFSDNEASSPFLLLKAGLAYDYAGKSEDAIRFLKALEDNYPNSSEASDAAKYLAKIEASL